MTEYLFIGGPLDGEYHEVDDPPPEVVPYLESAPHSGIGDYQPDATPYFVHTILGGIIYTVLDGAELTLALRCPICVQAGIYEPAHFPYPDAVPGDDNHGQIGWGFGGGGEYAEENPGPVMSHTVEIGTPLEIEVWGSGTWGAGPDRKGPDED